MCKRFTVIFVTVLLLAGISSLSWAAYILQYQGDITSNTGDGTLIATAAWDYNAGPPETSSTLEWWVSQDDATGEWKYEYIFTVPRKGISHGIIEVSQNFPGFQYEATGTDASGNTENLIIDNEAPKWYESTGTSGENPGMPDVDLEPGGEGDLFGIKWDAPTDIEDFDPLVFSITIFTDREPMWGDFYAKDGTDNGTWVYAYNTGFGQDTAAPVADGNALDNDGRAWVLVPDTSPVPEPATLLLLGLGLITLGRFAGRRKL